MSSTSKLDVAVVGAGVIGREHAARLAENPRSRVSAIVDPSPAASAWAMARSVPHYESVAWMLHAHLPGGAIIATPTRDHVATAIPLLEAGVPVLVEKPLAGELAEATRLVRTVERLGTPVLVGYHRRHSAIFHAAREYIAAGHLGRIVSVNGASLFCKPDRYFDIAWRKSPGGGPILINLAHEIDSLRALVGEISGVQAIASNRIRGHAVEDTAAVILEFESGALGALTVSDSAVAPFSWEQTAGENALYARDNSQDSMVLAGTHGSLSLPSLRWWRQDGDRSWARPFCMGRVQFQPADPLVRQLDHFLDVVGNRAEPAVPAIEGFRSLAATLAVRDAVATGRRVAPTQLCTRD
ncbi:MAG: Gfo/Idh/MocA family oxidoreductase [Bryobacteraceae bacterium]|nr:Gfo/Idh/MocA family oxidoreductase [Bryobacteraceae bacterium]